MRTVSKAGISGFILMSFLATGSSAIADELKFKAELTGSQEVPAVETSASGTADITYDTESNELSWSMENSGLSGHVAAAHFHGPAAPGENAAPVVTIDVSELAEGSVTLDDTQEADLLAERWYLNLHTAENPGGEIRGQVLKAE